MLALELWSIGGDDFEPEILKAYRDAFHAIKPSQSPLRIVDIGAGVGRDLRYISHGFKTEVEVVAVEPNQLAWPSIRAELTRWNLTGDVIAQLGELSEMAATFDVAVLQHVLCSVEDPHKLLLEARQLLKPGGILMFVEHMPEESAATFLGASQFFLKPMVKLCGCDLSMDALKVLQSVGWQALKFESFYLAVCGVKVPHIRGMAVKAEIPTCDLDFL